MDSPGLQPDSPMEHDDVVYPCKGCGDILEEGKAFELAGNRWHIDCFRCNTCGTLLDSDANLLLLGDGSLICNNCTYSCNACGNKIEDLAILTGDQAFCASCFRCRNCKRKIENLRYARTSQGIFCMNCHETLMARRKKKTARAAAQQQRPGPVGSSSQSPILLDKSLPSLPPNAVPLSSAFSPNQDISPSETFSETPTELSPRPRAPNVRHDSSRGLKGDQHVAEYTKDNLILPSTTYQSKRTSSLQDPRTSSDAARNDDTSEPFSFIPLAFDPSPAPGPSSMVQSQGASRQDGGRDYFNRPTKSGAKNQLQDRRAPSPAGLMRDQNSRPASRGGSTQGTSEKNGQPSSEVVEAIRTKERIRGDAFPTSTPDSTTSSPAPSRENTRIQHTHTPSGGKYGGLDNREHFRLQEVPQNKKSGASSRSTKSGDQSPDPSSLNSVPSNSTTSGVSQAPDDGQLQARGAETSQTLQPLKMNGTPRSSQETRRRGDQSADSTQASQLFQKPKREDSLGQQPPFVKGEDPALSPSPGEETPKRHQTSSSTSSHITPEPSNRLTPRESPRSSSLDRLVSSVPPRKPAPQTVADSFTAPRAPPPPPPIPQANHQQSSSISSGRHSESSRNSDTMAALPQYTASGDLSMDDDLARIFAGGNNENSSASLLRRVSSAVKHGRSFSDMTTRTGSSPKWPKSPTNGVGLHHYGHDISSPTSSSTPDLKEENSVLRHELRRKAQRIAELEARISNSVDMKKLDTNIREKRSTVAFLDTQKELMVRELEILTEHVAAAKKSGKPLNMESLKSDVLRDFAMSLQELKDTYGPEIEDLIHQKNQLMEEVANLGRLRDQAIQETEQLNSKNSQLADLNNELTNQIQERYKANRDQGMAPSVDSPRHGSNGLGIYTHHHKERSDVSMDGRDLRPPTGMGAGGSVASFQGDQSDDPTAVLTAPHIVNIRKGQAKKFNWKKGSQSVAKGVSKGFKGAFSSSNQNQQYQREGSITDAGVPYGSLPTDSPSGSLPRSATTSDLSQPSFKLFGTQKLQKAMPNKSQSNGNLPAAAESPSTLFGSALDQRAEYEKRQIPSVVTRCIEEVELRGMDLEGIYRKVGGNSQVKTIQEGFERNDDFDISDPTIDISAVTSVLKQYFRKLPVPLLTFDIYDKILESNSIYDEDERVMFLRAAIEQLPPSHRYCLEFLVFHLARVAQRDKENLMNPKNLAVVFAPTIMRDHSLAREMTDMHSKNAAIQFMIENNKLIFGGS